MVYGVWRPVSGKWCMVHGVWYVVHGVWYPGTRCVVYGAWCMACGTWYVAYVAWRIVYGVWCGVFGALCVAYYAVWGMSGLCVVLVVSANGVWCRAALQVLRAAETCCYLLLLWISEKRLLAMSPRSSKRLLSKDP
jgi:hypothetical protein